MKALFRTFLAYAFVMSHLVPYYSYAEAPHYSPQNIFRPGGAVDSGMLYLQGGPGSTRVINEYRLLGFSSFPDISSAELRSTLKSPSIVLSAEGNLSGNSQYTRLLESPEGRQHLIREYRQAFSNLSVVLNENLSVSRSELRAELRRAAIAEYSGPTQTENDKLIMREKITLQVNQQILEGFTQEEKAQARERLQQAKRIISDPQRRALFNYRNGLTVGTDPGRFSSLNLRNQIASARGYYTRRVLDPFGREVNVYLPKNAEARARLSQLNAPEMVKQLKSGAVEVGMFAAILYSFLGVSTAYQMVADFESNPMAFENSYDMAPLAVFSSLGFLFGGAATSLAADGVQRTFGIRTQSIKNTNFLLNEGKLSISNKALRSSLIRANMSAFKSSLIRRAATYSGMAGGMIFSQIAVRYADTLRSCTRILKFDYGTFPEYKQKQIEASCQKTFLGIIAEVTSDPMVWKDVVAIMLSRRAMLLLGSTGKQLAGYGFSNRAGSRAALSTLEAMPLNRPHNLKLILKFAAGGVKKVAVGGVITVVRVITSPTVIGFVLFMVVFELISAVFDFAIDRIAYNMPASIAAEQMRELMESYRSKGWDATKVCDDRTLFEGTILGTLKSLWNWDKEEQCSGELIQAFISHHSNVNKKWREKLLEPISKTLDQWTLYTFEAVNLYRSTYMFYKDIVDQVRVEKEMSEPIDFNKYKTSQNDDSGFGIMKPQAHLQTDRYNHPLPLFRSELFFGARYKNEEDENISYPLINGASVDWEERFNNKEKIDFLIQRMKSFRDKIIPQITRELESGPENLSDEKKEKAQEIADLLKSKELNKISEGLYKLSSASEEEGFRCAQTVAGGAQERYGYETRCFFNFRHKRYLDPDFWELDEDVPNGNAHKFLKSNNVFYAGYRTQFNRPFGIKPIGMGQRFLIKYYEKFKNNGVDHLVFEEGYRSLTDYLAKQMICGTDLEEGENMLSNPIRYKLGISLPKFKAPRLPRKTSFDPCGMSSVRRDGSGVKWFNGWYKDYGFYTYIEDTNDSSKNYGGFVELVYKEIPDHILNNFDDWWKQNVEPQFSEVLDKLYNDYYKDEFIDKQLSELITKGNSSTNCYDECVGFDFDHKYGIAASIKQEIDTYFTYFLEPLVDEVKIDQYYVNLDEKKSRIKLKADFKKLKQEIYSIFDFTSGRVSALPGEELPKIFYDLLASVSAEKTLIDPTASQNYDLIKVMALSALLNTKIYELQILFQTDSGVSIMSLFESSIAALNANPNLSEVERRDALEEFKQDFLTNTRDFDGMQNRSGKVLVEYIDWPEDQNKLSPTSAAVSLAQSSILKAFSELVKIEELKNSLKPVSLY